MSRKGGELNIAGNMVPYGLRFTNVMPSLSNDSNVALLFQEESEVIIWPTPENYDKNGLRNFFNQAFTFHHSIKTPRVAGESELQVPSDILPGTTFF